MSFVCRIAVIAALFTLPLSLKQLSRVQAKANCATLACLKHRSSVPNAPQGKGRLRSCLQEHQAELSENCKAAMGAQPKG